MDQQQFIQLIKSKFKDSHITSMRTIANKKFYFCFRGTQSNVDDLIPMLVISGFEFECGGLNKGSITFSCTKARLDLLRPLHASGITSRIEKKFPGADVSMCGTFKGIRYTVKTQHSWVTPTLIAFLKELGVSRTTQTSDTISFCIGGESRLLLGEHYAKKNSL